MAVVNYSSPRFSAETDTGGPLAAGKLYTYAAGTTTPLATYSDYLGATPNANPIILNARGEAVVYLTRGTSYKFVLKGSSDATIWTDDNVSDEAGAVLSNLASTTSPNGSELIGFVDTFSGSSSYLKTLSDIANGQTISIARFLNKAKISGIRDRTYSDSAVLTPLIQAALDSGARGLDFFDGKFDVGNLAIRGNTAIRGAGRGATVVACVSPADTTYFIASKQWLTAGSAAADDPIQLYHLTIQSNYAVDDTLVLRSYFLTTAFVQVVSGTVNGFVIRTRAKDGTVLGSTLVNNEVIGCRISNFVDSGGTPFKPSNANFAVIDPDNRATDMHVIDNWIFGSQLRNFYCDASAGLITKGNHFYDNGGNVAVEMHRYGLGSVFVGNYPDGEVIINTMVPTSPECFIGPGNYFKTTGLRAKFGNSGNKITSIGNFYNSGAYINHDFNGTKLLISQGDTFLDSNPIRFESGNTLGRYKIKDSFFKPTGEWLNRSGTASSNNPIFGNRATYDPASLADGEGVTTTVTCSNAATNTTTLCSFSNALSNVIMRSYGSAADTVAVRFQNETGGVVDLASGTIRVKTFISEDFLATGTATYNPPSLADAAMTSTTVSVPGAVVGDMVTAVFSNDLQGIIMDAQISAAGTATVYFFNETGGTIDLDSGTLVVRVMKNTSDMERSFTYDPASLADGGTTGTTIAISGCELGDYCLATFSLDRQGIIFHPFVSAVGTVTLRLFNETGGVIDLASGTAKVWVWKA